MVSAKEFQFHKGTIKTVFLVMFLKVLLDFNSIKVRLKPNDEPYKAYFIGFQFHKGTIKTVGNRQILNGVCVFQFHKGTIKTFMHYFSFGFFPISIP